MAQNPTGTLIGSVKDTEGGVLPEVTVIATSPALQGSRTALTDANGNYKLAFLNPGLYTVTYEFPGFSNSVRQIKVSAAQTAFSDISMELAGLEEEIVVTSNVETISETHTVATTITQAELDTLPTGRAPLDAVYLVPGVATTGPTSSPVVHGAMSFENLFLVNGVVVNENFRGLFLPLYIEDAILETTTSTAGISAEYGRFTGGVVNVITKSGGNELSGSLRVTKTSQKWESAKNVKKFDPDFDPDDTINDTFEATLGGQIIRDRLWWFGAGRDRATSSQETTAVTNISYPTSDSEERLEAKLTISPAQGHSLIGSYLEIDRTTSGATWGNVMALRSLSNRTDPQEITAFNYTGILTSNFFVEAQSSERLYEIATGMGGPQDLIEGTLMRHRPTNRRFWSPTFCGSCEPEQRDNENTLLKASYFLTSEGAGTHDLTFGYDTFSDIVFSVNHQTGSDFQVWAEDIHIDSSNNIFPIFRGSNTWIVWWPPLGVEIARPTDIETNSLYANDSWQLNDRWSFNVGVRYDENDGVNSSGIPVIKDSKVSPRLGLQYDVKGDGSLVVNASAGTYVAANNSVADVASTAGALAGFYHFYEGPPVNINCPPDCVTTDVALETLFGWYLNNGGTTDVNEAIANISDIPGLFYLWLPGASVIREGLKSPSADELTVGVTKRLGNKGMLRADMVYREREDFYSARTQLGDNFDANGDGVGDVDILEVGNFADDILERRYLGFEIQSRYRLTDRLTLAGNYTLSELEGNVDGEGWGIRTEPGAPDQWPEFSEARWSLPVGDLAADSRHKLLFWAVYDLIGLEHHNLSLSLLQRFGSGRPYGAVGYVGTGVGSLTGDYIRQNFPQVSGYAQLPGGSDYWFTARDAFHEGGRLEQHRPCPDLLLQLEDSEQGDRGLHPAAYPERLRRGRFLRQAQRRYRYLRQWWLVPRRRRWLL
jgi:hypothetical protein